MIPSQFANVRVLDDNKGLDQIFTTLSHYTVGSKRSDNEFCLIHYNVSLKPDHVEAHLATPITIYKRRIIVESGNSELDIVLDNHDVFVKINQKELCIQFLPRR